MFFSFYFYVNVYRNVTWCIYDDYLTIVTVALPHMGVLCYKGLEMFARERNGFAGNVCLYFVNKIYVPCCCIVYFCCLPAPQADLTRIRRVIDGWVSTAKRKTRLHTDFRSARRSKRINPLKITLPTQFLHRIEEEMLKVHVSSLTTQFGPQRLRYDTFISRLLRSKLSNIGCNPGSLCVTLDITR